MVLASPRPEEIPQRILVAIIPEGDSVYYLRATDDPARLDSIPPSLAGIVQKVTFENQRPKWELPENWIERPSPRNPLNELVYTKASPPVVFAVTQLGVQPNMSWDEYLTENVNRWRKMVALRPVPMDKVRSQLVEVPRPASDRVGYLFDVQGTVERTMAPGNVSGKTMGQAMSDSRDAAPPPKLEYRMPQGWTLQEQRAFRLASFSMRSDLGEGEVVVSAAKQALPENVQMWQAQIDPDGDQAAREAAVRASIDQAETLAIDDREVVIYVVKKSDEPKEQAVWVAVLPTDQPETSMFVKMRGSLELIQQQRNTLMDFIRSLKW
jgi:hypothetical protein